MKKIISLLVLICFFVEQSCFAQVLSQVLPLYFSQPSFLIQDKFRPIHLRSIEFTPQSKGLQVLLDKGDSKELKQDVLQEEAGKLMDYFLIGLTLPNDAFWVNLRPDQADNIIDPYLEKTDIGKVMLAADLNLKKDLALATSPATKEGREYWDKLYAKAQELFGDQQVSLPTFTRPWIVPGEIIIRQFKSNSSGFPANVYVYKATLKVMLEQDYLSGSAPQFEDNRLKELNDYSSELIRRLIIPKLTLKLNSSKIYAPLRQVYYSLILAQWMKEETKNGSGNNEKQSRVDSPQSIANKRLTIIDRYVSKINTMDLTGLTSKEKWEKNSYFEQYRQSFQKGEYNESETINTPYGQTIRQYTSGGIGFGALPAIMAPGAGNVLTGNKPFIPGLNLAAVSVDEEGSVVVGAQSMARSKRSSDGGVPGTKSPAQSAPRNGRQGTDMEQSLEVRYRDAVRGYFSQLNDLEAEVKEEKLVPGTPPWMEAALNVYAGLIKGIMPVLEDSGQEITFVYPFEGADSIPALLRRTYHLNYEISDLDLGEEALKKVFGEEKRAEIINRDTPLDALEKSNYEIVRNAIKGPCVFILKGFAGWAKKNKAPTFNKDLLRFILVDVLRAGDKVLILSKNDLELYNSLSEKLKTDFLKQEQYVFEGKTFFIGAKGANDDSWEKSIRLPNAIMILEKKPVTSAQDGGEELRQRRAWLDDYEKALVVSSGRGFKPGEVNSPEVIRSITAISGTPIADINKKAQKHAYSMSGFADDVIEQMVMDDQTVARLGTTHKELAGLLWMVVEKCCNREERFSYNGMDYRLELWGSLGSQFSIFSNKFWWGGLDDFTLINITQGTSQKFTSNSIAEIGALGFYEGRVVGGAINKYAVDPELLWRMFKDKDYRKPYVSVEEALAKRAERIKKQEGWDSVKIYTLPQLKNVLPFVIRPIAKPRYQEEFYSESEKEKTDYRPWEQTYVFEVRKKGPWTAIVRIGIRYSDAVVENTGAKAAFWGSGVDVFRGNTSIYATNNFRPEALKKETGFDLVNILESFDRKEKTRITDDERWFYNELRFSASEQLGTLFISAISKDLDYPSLLEDIFGSNFIYEFYDFAVSYRGGKHFIPLSRQLEIIKTLLYEEEERRSNAINTAVPYDNGINDGGRAQSFARFFDYLRLYGLKDTAWESKRSGQEEKQTSDFWQLIEEEMRATALFVENTMGDNHITYMRLKGVPLYMDLGLREISRSGFNPDVVVFLATEAVPLEVCYRLLRERRGLKVPEYVVLEVHMPRSEGADYGSLNKPEEEEKIRENIIRETKGIEIKGKQVLIIDATAYNGFTMGLTRDAFLSLGVTGLKTFSLMSHKFIPNYVPDYVGVCVEDTPLMVWAKMLLNEGATNEVRKILAAVTFLYLNQTEGKEDRLLDKIAIAKPVGMKELLQGAKLLTLKDLKGNWDGGKSIARDEGNRERVLNEQNNLIQRVIDKLKPQLADSRYAERLLKKAKVDFDLPVEGQWAIRNVIREAKAGTVFLYLPTIDIEDGDLPEKAAMISIWGKPAVEKMKGKRPYPLNEVPFINEVIFPDNDVFLVSKSRNGVNATAKLGFFPDGAPVLVKTTISPITIEEIKKNDDFISKCLLTKVVAESGFAAPLHGFFKDPSTGSISLVMDIINGDFPSAAGELISVNVMKDCIEFRKELRDLNLYMSDDLQPIIDRSGRIKFIDDPIVTRDDAVAVAFQDEIFIRLISQILCAAQKQEVIASSLKYFREAYPELFHMLLASLEQKDEYAANAALQKAVKQVKHLQGGIVSPVTKVKADGGAGQLGKAAEDGGKGDIDSSVANSSPAVLDKKLGGIDFRNLPITAQPVPAVPLGVQVPIQAKIPLAELDNEWSRIKEIVDNGSIPSGERIKEYVLSCCQRGDISAEVEKVLVCISDILRLEEDYALACEPGFVRLLSVLESDKPAQELQIALSAVSFEQQ